MNKRSNLPYRVLLVIPLVLLINMQQLFQGSMRDGDLSYILWRSFFGTLHAGEVGAVVLSFECFGFLFLFSLLYGNYILDYFEHAPDICFVRVDSRAVWTFGKIGDILIYGVIYTALFMSIKFFLEYRTVENACLSQDVALAVVMIFGILYIAVTTGCILVGLLALKTGLPAAIVLVFFSMICLEARAMTTFDHPYSMVLNPFCFNEQLLGMPGLMSIKMLTGVLYMAVAAGVTVRAIDQMDIY